MATETWYINDVVVAVDGPRKGEKGTIVLGPFLGIVKHRADDTYWTVTGKPKQSKPTLGKTWVRWDRDRKTGGYPTRYLRAWVRPSEPLIPSE